MDYRKIYKAIVERSKSENRLKGDVYYENHHIIPTFMFRNNRRNKGGINLGHLDGNPNDKNNLVLLTAREHFLCHVLLYKIYKGTRYEFSCGASLMLFFNVIESKHLRVKDGNFSNLGKKYEQYRLIGIDSISKMRSGTMPVKDFVTGIMIGSVSVNHPKVISGEWVHHSKGVPISEDRRDAMRYSMSGMGNNNALSDFTEQDALLIVLGVYNEVKDDKSIISSEGHIHKSRFMKICNARLHEKYPERRTSASVIFNRIGTRNIAAIINEELNLSLINCDIKIKFPGSLPGNKYGSKGKSK